MTRPRVARFVSTPCLALLALVTAAIGSPVLAQSARGRGPGVELEVRLWSPELSGQIEVREAGIGTRIDLDSDLGLQDDEFLEGRLSWRLTRRQKLRIGFMPLAYSGSQVVSRTIEFGGQTFALDARVDSDLDLEYGRVGWAWQFLATGDGAFRVGPLIEAKGFRGDAALAAETVVGGISASESFEAAFAAVGLALDLEPSSRLHVFAEATQLVGTDEGDFRDAEAGVRFLPTSRIGLVLGYRLFDLDAEEGDDFLDVEIEGFFFGADVSF